MCPTGQNKLLFYYYSLVKQGGHNLSVKMFLNKVS